MLSCSRHSSRLTISQIWPHVYVNIYYIIIYTYIYIYINIYGSTNYRETTIGDSSTTPRSVSEDFRLNCTSKPHHLKTLVHLTNEQNYLRIINLHSSDLDQYIYLIWSNRMRSSKDLCLCTSVSTSSTVRACYLGSPDITG